MCKPTSSKHGIIEPGPGPRPRPPLAGSSAEGLKAESGFRAFRCLARALGLLGLLGPGMRSLGVLELLGLLGF